jgi:uncharacterized cupin superfamily protein
MDALWQDAPIPSDWLLVGNPRPVMCLTSVSRRTGATSGRWRCEASVFNFSYVADEWIYIISGDARVTIGQRVRELKPGDSAFFPKGATALWEVSVPVEKSFVLAGPSFAERLVQKIRQIAGKVLRVRS